MKILLYLIIFVLVGLVILSVLSRKPVKTGMVDNQLRQCPDMPNCVCSEYESRTSFIDPITYSIAHEDAWQGIKEAIISTGGEISVTQDKYLHAIYRTPVLRFIDDVEVRIDEDSHLIHIRSSSRVGHSDFGVNRNRVERIRNQFTVN